MVLTLYTASVSHKSSVKYNQERIKSILTSKKIEFEEKDIVSDDAAKAKKNSLVPDKMMLCPILCNDEEFIADMTTFEQANEDGDEALRKLLKLN